MLDVNRILVLGGSGMVGSQISFGIRPTRAEVDITDASSIARAFETYAPVAVMHLAGLVDVKTAENDPVEAERVNVGGAALVADACAAAGTPLVFFSSCMIFDGAKSSPYVESDVPNPPTVYGKTKLAGENEVLARAPRSLVIRTGWLFGGLDRDIKFVKRFHDALVRGESLRATNDRFGSPTYTPDLIAETVRLLQASEAGVFHVVNDGIASYFQVAEHLKGLTQSSAAVTGLSQRELDPDSEPRGAMEGLVSERGILLRHYKDALAEYVDLLHDGRHGI